MDNKPKQENREAILNAILPPREWVEQGKHLNRAESVTDTTASFRQALHPVREPCASNESGRRQAP